MQNSTPAPKNPNLTPPSDTLALKVSFSEKTWKALFIAVVMATAIVFGARFVVEVPGGEVQTDPAGAP
jgi:hypothetical protein